LIFIGLMGGSRGEVNLATLLLRRLHLVGSTLRSREPEDKAEILARFWARFGEDLESGAIRPIVDRVLPLERVQEAHDIVERSEHFGKVVLHVD
jgi:NADPH:quinone reductase-like Zn-dependent oxidoreductase